jgi:hypothetical protein
VEAKQILIGKTSDNMYYLDVVEKNGNKQTLFIESTKQAIFLRLIQLSITFI